MTTDLESRTRERIARTIQIGAETLVKKLPLMGIYFSVVGPIISLHPQHYLAIHIPHSIYNHQSTILQFSHLVPTKYLQSKNMV